MNKCKMHRVTFPHCQCHCNLSNLCKSFCLHVKTAGRKETYRCYKQRLSITRKKKSNLTLPVPQKLWYQMIPQNFVLIKILKFLVIPAMLCWITWKCVLKILFKKKNWSINNHVSTIIRDFKQASRKPKTMILPKVFIPEVFCVCVRYRCYSTRWYF